MEKQERLQAAYEYLRSRGKVHTQKDVASAMKATRQNVSSALKGKERFLTDSFLRRFNIAFGEPFNIDWLISGEGEMLATPSILPAEKKPEQQEPQGVAEMLKVICQQAEEIGRLKQRIEELTQRLEKNAVNANARTSASAV